MTIEQFESWSLTLGISGLILWMLMIIWKMGQESKAGKFGYSSCSSRSASASSVSSPKPSWLNC